ncbi:sn-glycerol-3-phosphate ABC transporter ATP-binding protein UgpC [Leucothrix sargassi]|nr:sn-glycerol-3-phosphate ABC transporter ATP-binding protein UgpC [Leucothrix sargassi]
MSFVTLKNVNKQYKKGTHVIKDVSLEIAAGEFLVIVGPSGCGKSTLLRMVAGLEKTTGGQIFIDGRDVTKEEPGERDIAMVFQNYALYPHMSVYDNMAYGLRNRNVPETEIKTRVESASKSLQLSDYLQRKPSQLSGGQRQRVAMGRAIVRNPKVFLFDEPLSNLDAKLRTQMRVEIKRLQRELGTTSIYVTHDQVEAMTLADRLIVLNKGNIDQIGTPKELYAKPQTTFVAGFLGSPSMNFVESESVSQFSEELTQRMQNYTSQSDAHGIDIGVRPEQLFPLESWQSADIQLNVSVLAVEDLGADCLIYLEVEKDRTQLIWRAAAGVEPEVGSTLSIGANIASLHLFDHDSGTRIEI